MLDWVTGADVVATVVLVAELTVKVEVEEEVLLQVDPVGLTMLVIPDIEDMTGTLEEPVATTIELSEVEATGVLGGTVCFALAYRFRS